MKDRRRSGRSQRRQAGAPMLDYSPQAARLFDNMRAPASFIAGSLVPLGFFASPKLSPDDGSSLRRAKKLHYLLATVAICCELNTIMWSTIATNKLVELHVAPTTSVMELFQRDYELEWIGCNVNFMIGLMGFASCLGTFAYIMFAQARRYVLPLVAASVSLMVSIINHGVSQGDGDGFRFGGNFLDLFLRYNRLLVARAVCDGGVFVTAAILLYSASIVLAVREVSRGVGMGK